MDESRTWHAYEDGTTMGQRGSEAGVIVQDQEHPSGARITLERCHGRAFQFAITCGVYGRFFHTHYCDNADEARHDVEAMKKEIDRILDLQSSESSRPPTDRDIDQAVSDFVERFPT